MSTAYKRVGHLKTGEAFLAHLTEIGVDLPFDEEIQSAAEGSPLSERVDVGGIEVGNRFAIHPMEGWDGTRDGKPTEHTIRRWRNFGLSGAKLIWGGEAFAVQHDGRANPNQLYYADDNVEGMRELYETLVGAHREAFGENADEDLLVGLQLTHSGRFSRPNDKAVLEPKIAYHHPVLDEKFGIAGDDDSVVLTDEEIEEMIANYVRSAKMASEIGFRFVDVKHCHGYLGHEFLSGYHRKGKYGGSFENRTRFMREIIEGIKAACPDMLIGVRLSVFDMPPFRPDPAQTGGGKFGPGIPEEHKKDHYPAFGCSKDDPLEIDLAEPIQLLELMRDELGVVMVNVSAGSPYYNPHIQRPAYFPPSDGYQPPEDPLVGCARQIEIVKQLKQAVPGLPLVGSAYTYFQEYLPNISQALVREGYVDFVGLGRMVLSYWDMPHDILSKGEVEVKRICRTFSDCTTAPRNGIISGCYPLDEYYKKRDEHAELKDAKKALRERLKVVD